MKKLTHEQISSRRLSVDAIPPSARLPVIGLLDNVRSLYNVGSIFRTSDGALIQKLILTGFTPPPPRREIEKTALGATKSVPWEYCSNPADALLALKAEGFQICCLEQTDRSFSYTQLSRSHFPLCLAVGNEINGVSPAVLSVCDLSVEIPMFGTKHSLNVAVAYGIVLFELSRLWRGNFPT